ncbi:MAG: vanadium-dependent haloperoxidase [Burkholderiales bacterium]
MIRGICFIGHLALLMAPSLAVANEPTSEWMRETLSQIVIYQQNPLRAARSLSLVSVAINDAILGVLGQGESMARARAAAHIAAGDTLAHLYPQTSPGRFQAKAFYLAADTAHQENLSHTPEWLAGKRVAAEVVRRALADGTDRIWNPSTRPLSAPGVWRGTPPLNMHTPLEPLAGTWRTWVLEIIQDIDVPAPVHYGSETYQAEAREVWEVTRNLSARQKQIASEWHLEGDSVTPAGVWNLKLLSLAGELGLETVNAAQFVSAANVAMMDALIATWHVKYKYWTARPVQAIRESIDAAFLPFLVTPAFPGYVSGHAALSGAVAEVIACHFPAHAQRFREQAEQAAMSRLHGGIHFRSDNEAGLALGVVAGRKVCAAAAKHQVRWLNRGLL